MSNIKSRKSSNIEQITDSNLNKTNEKERKKENKTNSNLNETENKFDLTNSNENNKKEQDELKEKLSSDINKSRRKSINVENIKNFSKRNSIISDLPSNLSSKRSEVKSPKTKFKKKKKKKRKESTKSIISGEDKDNKSIYLTEVKKVEKQPEDSKSYRFLKNKLDELKIPNNFQLGLKLSFDNIFKTVNKNIDINENKKITIEELVNKNNKFTTINNNINDKGINYGINKENIRKLNNLNNDSDYIKKELLKIEQNKKMLESISPVENDILGKNLNNAKLKEIKSKENILLNKLKENKLKINSLIEDNKTINRKQLLLKFVKNNNSCKDIISNNIKTRNNKNAFLEFRQYNSLNDEQQNFNRQLLLLNKESIKTQAKFEKDLKKSKEKKMKQLDLKEQQIISQRKNYLENLKNNEKEFFNKIKQKNDLILEYSNKYIKEKRRKKEKDYLFNKLKEKFENSEKKLIERVNMVKKEPLVTKEEITELANRIDEQKKILEEGLNERKEKMLKMWKERSQTLPVYKHPLVDIIEDEDYDLLENEEEKLKQKEINLKEKKNYKPPKVKINQKLKEIRENRNLKTTKEDLMRTEIKNKFKLLNSIQLNYNNNSQKKNNHKRKSPNIDEKEKIRKKIIGPPHPKPDKPIDYLKILIKENKNKIKKDKKDFSMGMGSIFNNLSGVKKNKKNDMIISEYVELAKSKNREIEKKVKEKKLFLKLNGGYLLNTQLGDEVGNLLIESIQSKLNILNQLNGK